MKSKHKSSISDENLAFELRCAVSVQCTPDFEDLVKKCETLIFLKYWLHSEMVIAWIYQVK